MNTFKIRNGFTAAILSLILISCATTDYVTGQQTRNLFSLEDDISLGKDVMKDIKAEMKKEGVKTNKDPKRVAQLQRLVGELAAVSHLPDLPYEVYLFDTNIVNAMALPGGKFIVFQGLFDKKRGLVKNEAELAFVLGHEMAHVTCRHATEEMTRNLPADLILTAISIYAEVKEDEDLADIVGAAFVLYNGLWVTKYSRVDELEADRIGMMYMARAGYNPQAAIDVWKRVYEEDQDSGSVLTLLSTHPPSKVRYEELEKILPEALVCYNDARKNGLPGSESAVAATTKKPDRKMHGLPPRVKEGSEDDEDANVTGLISVIQQHEAKKQAAK
jgi:predicted Zn-dependent protease